MPPYYKSIRGDQKFVWISMSQLKSVKYIPSSWKLEDCFIWFVAYKAFFRFRDAGKFWKEGTCPSCFNKYFATALDQTCLRKANEVDITLLNMTMTDVVNDGAIYNDRATTKLDGCAATA
jgi:hypothetical protein